MHSFSGCKRVCPQITVIIVIIEIGMFLMYFFDTLNKLCFNIL